MDPMAVIKVPSKRLFTRRQAQEYLGVSKKTMFDFARDGRIPSYTLRGWTVFKLEDLEAFVDELEEAS